MARDMTQTRRLAAILAADVAGYSRLIGADEEGTLNRLRSIRFGDYRPQDRGTPGPHRQNDR
jgi:class 3 adenylate cyclase